MELRSGKTKSFVSTAMHLRSGRKAYIGTTRKHNSRKPRNRSPGRTVRKRSKSPLIILRSVVYVLRNVVYKPRSRVDKPRNMVDKSEQLPPVSISTHNMDLRVRRAPVPTVVKKLRRRILLPRNIPGGTEAQHHHPLPRGWSSAPTLALPGTWQSMIDHVELVLEGGKQIDRNQHCRTQADIGCQPLSPIPNHIKKILEDLHLPYYDTSIGQMDPDSELSIFVLATHLGWTISTSERVPVPSERNPAAELYIPSVAPLAEYVRHTRLAMNLPPTGYPDVDVDADIIHQRHRFASAGLVLPSDWEPLQQGPIYCIPGGTSDSARPVYEGDYKLVLDPTSEIEKNSALSAESSPLQTISVSSCKLWNPRIRSEWEVLHILHLDQMDWRLETARTIAQRDERRRTGNIDQNQSSQNKDIWPQSSIPAYIAYEKPLLKPHKDLDPDVWEASEDSNASFYHGSEDDERQLLQIPLEINSDYRVGDVIANIISSDALPISRNRVLRSPQAFKCLNRDVAPSLACHISPSQLQWEIGQLPLLFVAQHCQKGDEDNAKAQIAYSFHQTLVALVFYYLDTRNVLDEQLPHWMVLYGIIYHESGFTVHAHFPVFHFSAADTDEEGPRNFGWAFYSNDVMSFEFPSSANASVRMGIVALLRIQSHARFLLKTLQKWTGYERTLKRLHEPVVLS